MPPSRIARAMSHTSLDALGGTSLLVFRLRSEGDARGLDPWRREWDLNPRCPEAQWFSRPSDSAALASLRRGSVTRCPLRPPREETHGAGIRDPALAGRQPSRPRDARYGRHRA